MRATPVQTYSAPVSAAFAVSGSPAATTSSIGESKSTLLTRRRQANATAGTHTSGCRVFHVWFRSFGPATPPPVTRPVPTTVGSRFGHRSLRLPAGHPCDPSALFLPCPAQHATDKATHHLTIGVCLPILLLKGPIQKSSNLQVAGQKEKRGGIIFYIVCFSYLWYHTQQCQRDVTRASSSPKAHHGHILHQPLSSQPYS